MAEPKISWQLLEEVTVDTYEYVQYKSYTEEGSSVPGSTIERTIRVWNNYMGKTTVDDALDCSLVLAFKNFEDNFLLNLITIYINDEEQLLEINNDGAIVSIGDLSGISNSGSDLNTSNYIEFKIEIGPIPNNIKSELKSLYFYLEYNSENTLI